MVADQPLDYVVCFVPESNMAKSAGFQLAKLAWRAFQLQPSCCRSTFVLSAIASLFGLHSQEVPPCASFQVNRFEVEAAQVELIRADWEMEKGALEELVVKLRAQLRDKEEQLSILQQTSMVTTLRTRSTHRKSKHFDCVRLKHSARSSSQRSDESVGEDTVDMIRQLEEYKQLNREMAEQRDNILREQVGTRRILLQTTEKR